MSQFQDLPDELLVEVHGCLPKSDLKSARLTCTRCSLIGAQFLFKRVYFAPRKAAIETFLAICANPIFAQTPTELVYDGRLFLSKLTAYEPFKEAFNNSVQDDDIEDDSNADEATIRKALEARGVGDYDECLANSLVRYARLYEQQQSILDNKEDYEALSTGLQKLRKVTKVTVLDQFFCLRTDEHPCYHQRSLRDIATNVAPSCWDADEDIGSKRWDVRGIQHLLRAVSIHGQDVVGLDIASEFSRAPISIFEMDKDVYDDTCVLARRLKELKVELDGPHRTDNTNTTQVARFNDILSEAKSLSCLALCGFIDKKCIKKKYWPNLRCLVLGNMFLKLDNLRVVIQGHKSTLRCLTLRNIYMPGKEGWVRAAKEIGKDLSLCEISICPLMDEVTEKSGTKRGMLDDKDNETVAYSFMQSIPQPTLIRKWDNVILTADPEEGEGVDPFRTLSFN